MTAADQAAAALQAAIDRHTGWQLEYDVTVVVADRKRLLDRIAELETALAGARHLAATASTYDEWHRLAAFLRNTTAPAVTPPDRDNI